jgi:DNA-binding XRE family transcriptional regulator
MFTEIIQKLIATGLTETEIAEKVNSTQPTINRIRNGNQEPKGNLAVALINLLSFQESNQTS